MTRGSWLLCAALLLGPVPLAVGQTSQDFDTLKKELELLKKEVDLLKRENDLLKKENESLKKGGSARGTEKGGDEEKRVVVDDVEYVYQGSTRKGTVVFVTVLATSKNGEQKAPHGQMNIIDADGEKFVGMPTQTSVALKEGVPIKLTWRFGFSPLGGANPKAAPSAKVNRFAAVVIHPKVAGNDETIDFKDVPAVVTPAKK